MLKNDNDLLIVCKKYRKELFEKFVQVGQGHPGSVFSMIEIVVTLFYKNFIRFDKIKNTFIDKILISKGHATVALYPILRDFGVIKEEEWNNWGISQSQLRVFGNISIPGIDVTSGSLGHGLGVGCGLALSYKIDKLDKKVYVVISEGELYEGSTWEALLFASHHKLDNLVVIIDINSLIILGTTEDCLNLGKIKNKIESFDVEVDECDGHDLDELTKSLLKKNNKTKFILAKTTKGKGFSLMENKANWHYWNKLSQKEVELCLSEIL